MDYYYASREKLKGWYDDNLMGPARDNINPKIVDEDKYSAIKEIFFYYSFLCYTSGTKHFTNKQPGEKYNRALDILRELAALNKAELSSPASPHIDEAIAIFQKEIDFFMTSHKWYEDENRKRAIQMLTDAEFNKTIQKEILALYNKKLETFKPLLAETLTQG